MQNEILISVVLPCRNEETALADCLNQIKNIFSDHRLNGEIIVSDSSTDRSPDIAKKAGVILVKHDQVGYGRAYLEGLKATQGKYLFMADPDGSYDFNELPIFIAALDDGFDFALGNRFGGRIEKGAMPWLHHYLGSPFFSLLFKILFKTNVNDVHCGMRMIKIEALKKLELKSAGMEFASEMIIKAIKNKLKIKQININYHPRRGTPKLRPFIDGFRHLKLILLESQKPAVIPAHSASSGQAPAGIQENKKDLAQISLDPRFRGDDNGRTLDPRFRGDDEK